MPILYSGNKWIKSADVQNDEVIIFKDEGKWEENTKYKYPDGNPKMDFVITVLHGGKEKKMRLNGTNRAKMAELYGKDTAKWVDKSAIIQKMTALVAGKKLDVIVLEANNVDQTEDMPY